MIDITQPTMILLKDGQEISRHRSAVEAMEKASKSGPGTYTLVRPDATIEISGDVVEPEPEPEPEPTPVPIGAMFDFQHAPTLYQDIAGTVPVTEFGQPVGRAVAGNGLTAKAPNDNSRPIYTERGLLFDGIDDVLYTDPVDLSGTDEATLAVAGYSPKTIGTGSPAAETFAAFWNAHQGHLWWYVGKKADEVAPVFCSGGSGSQLTYNKDDTASETDPAALVGRCSIANDLSKATRNGVTTTLEQEMGGGPFGIGRLCIGRREAYAYLSGYVAAVFLAGRFISDEETEQLSELLMQKAGDAIPVEPPVDPEPPSGWVRPEPDADGWQPPELNAEGWPDDPNDYVKKGTKKYVGPIPPAPDPVQTRTSPLPVGGIGLEFAGACLVPSGRVKVDGEQWKYHQFISNCEAMTVDPATGYIWASGPDQFKHVAAFEPTWQMTQNPDELVEGVRVTDWISTWNGLTFGPRHIISGMKMIDGRLWVALTDFYDATGNNTITHVVIDPQTKDVTPWIRMQGAARVSGWLQPIPEEWQERLGGPWLAGHAENLPIAFRNSNGPSLFVWDGVEQADIATTPIINYTLDTVMNTDRYNRGPDTSATTLVPKLVGDNDLWTVESEARIGFILGDKYIVFGRQGAMRTGIGYKIVTKDGAKQEGPSAYDRKDYDHFFWQYDLNDVLAGGVRHPIPEKWGIIDPGFGPADRELGIIKSADWDGEFVYFWLGGARPDYGQPGKNIVARYRVTVEGV
jgi:hypothetical protein